MGNSGISENINDCKQQHLDFCETLDEIKKIYGNVSDAVQGATWWTGDSKEQFNAKMNKHIEELEELKKVAEQEEVFFETWNNAVTRIHNIFDDLAHIIGGI